MRDIPPRYNPKDFEQRIYSRWEQEGLFHVEPTPLKKPFTIVIPPPNITGILHMGHALNNTIQDILIRWRRMQGFVSLWLPGTDHAGIATQNVVERSLAEEGITRQGLGRERFVKKVWEWREKYGNTIIAQLKRLGASCDWDRTRFTMDAGLSKAVLEAFIRLYKKGLIYRGNYIINWCPRCQTAISDEEAPHVDTKGKLYYIMYPFKGVEGTGRRAQGVVVATTRPETMLGDVAVAVHPKDKRYKNLIGARLILPIMQREIPIIADEIVDRRFGTGAVKVTPAHDPNDFEISKRHKLKPILIMAPDGRMNQNAGKYNGVDRFEARKAIIDELKQNSLLVKIEEHHHAVGHCYRCHTVIEPYLSLQWFVKMEPLATPAIQAVKKGKIKFHPRRWTKVYLNWMENIRDWCISRQIWWGHRLPVYYCESCMKQATGLNVQGSTLKTEKGVIVSRSRPKKCPVCGSGNITQDEDVLDTWFSSWLWPFSTLGWPGKTKDLNYFYPTSVLVTAPEILFFWVARMIMAGLEFVKDIPFKDIYIHGTVRDITGKKMSKSLGNIIDPIDIIDEFGADALRYSMIAITATGQDVFLSREKFEIGRNFANKIWNASRFVLMNIGSTDDITQDIPSRQLLASNGNLADAWILSRLQKTIRAVNRAMENYRFNEAESVIYDFFWHEFCDWYVEMSKPGFYKRGFERQKDVLIYVLEDSLKLLHPFMPFVTEAIWQNIRKRQSIMVERWPEMDESLIDDGIERVVNTIRDIIINIRNIRSDMNIPYSKALKVIIVPLKKTRDKRFDRGLDYIKHLAHIEELQVDKDAKRPSQSATCVLEDYNVFVLLKGVIDIDGERLRLEKKKKDLEEKLRFSQRRLKNKDFISKAPSNVVSQEKERAEKLREQIDRIKATTKSL